MLDLFALPNNQLFAMMIDCIKGKRCEDALLLWGLVQFRNEDEKRYYLASIYGAQERYEEAIFYFKTITDKKFKENVEFSILDAYAKQGNARGFLDYYANDYNGVINHFALCNFLYDILYFSEAYKLVDFGEYYSVIEEIKNVEKTTDADDEGEIELFLLKTYQLMGLYIESLKESEILFSEKSNAANVNTIAKTYGIYYLINTICPPYGDEYPIERFLENFDDAVAAFIEDMKRHIIEFSDNLRKWMVYFSVLESIASDEILVSEVCENIDVYPMLLDSFGSEVILPLLTAYSKAINSDVGDYKKIEKVLYSYGVTGQTLANATTYESVIRGLSSSSQIAYKAACTMYTLAKTNNYENRDAGPISLAFYRILERESNIAIWRPILERLSIKTIKSEYAKLDRNGKENWKKLKNIFIGMLTDDKNPELMLGNLRVLMGLIREPEDNLARLLNDEFVKVLTEEGIEAYKNGAIDDWYSDENSSRYRNPPAHAKYLHFELAEQCKMYVEEQLINFGKWIIRNPLEE